MKQLLLLTFSLLLTLSLFGQVDSLDSAISTPPEKVRFVRPTFSLDYGKALLTVANIERRLEGSLSLVFFDHYYLTSEIGTATLTPRNAIQNGTYFSEGDYFRIGGGYQTAINANSKLGLGARYGISSFSDGYEIKTTSAAGIQADNTILESRSNLEARWLELVIHSESDLKLKRSDPAASINRLISLGFQVRFRFLSTYDQFTPYNVYSVPGYGSTINNPNVALNFYLKINPFR